MAGRFPRLRIVRTSEALRERRRRPGIAVVLILLYAGIFGAGLLWFRAASPLWKTRNRRAEERSGPLPPPAGAAAARKTPEARSIAVRPEDQLARRAALLSGEGLPSGKQAEYVRRIAAERCTCGCDDTVQACLARDRSCMRSREIAEKIRASIP